MNGRRVAASKPCDASRGLAAAAKKAREWTERRDELVRAMRAEGASLREIASVAGVTHTAVAKILARRRGEEPPAAGSGLT